VWLPKSPHSLLDQGPLSLVRKASGPYYSVAVFTTTCDQMRRAAEWAALEAPAPVFLMNVPATHGAPAAARLYRDELHRLGRFLARRGASRPSPEKLADVMQSYDARRR